MTVDGEQMQALILQMQGLRPDPSGRPRARFPALAPRQDAGLSSPSQSANPSLSATTSEGRRSRLPPRSRTGCWTCRTRKVKCDEQRPACGQCQRLRHTCDYNPRPSFRDDTPRVVDRMPEVSRAGCPVWDSNISSADYGHGPSEEDELPPFSSLATDEDRERKAESHDAGTYFLVAVPSSFSSLPEYCDESTAVSGLSQTAAHLAMSGEDEKPPSGGQIAAQDDPNVVTLKYFEDTTWREPAPSQTRAARNPASPASSHPSGPRTPSTLTQTRPHGRGESNVSMLDIARSGGRDAELLQHYRTTISSDISPLARSEEDEDVFEIQARTYPPLFHAIMALSALSMAHRNGLHSADALEHYQQALPALKSTVQSSQDSYSDGTLFTHFILLIYEVAAAGRQESNMWHHHSDQLQRIITLRRQVHGSEPYEFLVWIICCIDIYAVLSANGSGTFVEAMLEQNMVPSPERSLHPIVPGPAQVFYQEERLYLSELLNLNQEVLLFAHKLGKMARDLRAEATQRRYGHPTHMEPELMFLSNRQARVQNIQSSLHSSGLAWKARFPHDPQSPRVSAWGRQSCMLYRAWVIYAHTSMFPNQLRDITEKSAAQVERCATAIIEDANMIISQEGVELRFTVFPLFIAGFASKNPTEKDLLLNLIKAVEIRSYGRSTETARKLLETIYEKQRAATLRLGDASSVEWVEEMELSGERLIIYGL